VAATFPGDTPLETDAPDADAGTGANRRGFVRVKPDEKNRLTATLASGSDIRLIDLSRGGAQFECDRRFLPNATVSLRLVTSDGEVLVTGRVVRSRIVRRGSGGLGYMVAVAFAKPVQTDLEGETGAAPTFNEPETPAVETPATSEPATPVTADGPTASAPASPPPPTAQTPTDPSADISAEEVLAFEATLEVAPAMLTVTATVDTTSEQLHDMFNGNDW
jgi:hypothetical protein